MGGGCLSALFLSGAAYQPEELSLARIADGDHATASDSPAYPWSLDESAGRLCNWEIQGPTGYYRTAAAEIPVQFPGNDRAIQRLGSCAGPGTQMAACCVWHL